jgi:hypothetical protein
MLKQPAQYFFPIILLFRIAHLLKQSGEIFTSYLFKFARAPRLTFAQRLHSLVRLIRRFRIPGVRLIRWLGQRRLLIRVIRKVRQRWLLTALRVRRCSRIAQWRFHSFVRVGGRVVGHDMAPGKGRGGRGGNYPMPSEPPQLPAVPLTLSTEIVRLAKDARCSKLLASKSEHSSKSTVGGQLWINQLWSFSGGVFGKSLNRAEHRSTTVLLPR